MFEFLRKSVSLHGHGVHRRGSVRKPSGAPVEHHMDRYNMSVAELFGIDDLKREMADGFVKERKHDTEDLWIYNYTQKAVIHKHWTDVTINCRGLILDGHNNIVARPWQKFFNYGEVQTLISADEPVEVTEKVDGSLGILYYSDLQDKWCISTKGSFNSAQANWATEHWNTYYTHIQPDHWNTYLFEIVYPENRIVLDYGDKTELVLLGAVNVGLGYYSGPRSAAGLLAWDGPVNDVLPYNHLSEVLSLNREDREGVVVRAGSRMVKIKEPAYLDMHRIVTNLSSHGIWELLKDGKTLTEILDMLPRWAHPWAIKEIQHTVITYLSQQGHVWDTYRDARSVSNNGADRKAFALYLKSINGLDGVYFAMLDGKDPDQLIWNHIEPAKRDPGDPSGNPVHVVQGQDESDA